MKDPFSSIPEGKNELNANVFDLTHTVNLSTKLGQLTPFFTKKFYPHSSLSFDISHAFQFMPMVFPIQTRIKCRVSFYKMPLRAMWKDYQNWMSTVNTPQHANYEPPYINFYSASTGNNVWSDDLFKVMFGTSSLADYFGVPTTFDGFKNRILGTAVGEKIVLGVDDPVVGQTFQTGPGVGFLDNPYNGTIFGFELNVNDPDAEGREFRFNRVSVDMSFPGYDIDDFGGAWLISYYATSNNNYVISQVVPLRIESSEFEGSNIFASFVLRGTDQPTTFVAGTGTKFALLLVAGDITKQANQTLDIPITYVVQNHMSYADVNGGEISRTTFPWYNSYNQTGLKLSSYPWRMYNAIYNTFVRNIRNNPLVIAGQVEYNKVTSTYDYGGSETQALSNVYNNGVAFSSNATFFEYFGPKFANWELDQFTSAVPTPMEGIAPLVGLTVRQVTTTSGVDANGNPVQTTNLNQYLTDEDGNTYKVTLTTDDLGNVAPLYEQVEMIEGTPLSTLYDAVSEGISIADFRDVNAYTRYLELNQRRGYRYKDIIEGRYDVNVRFDELLMPEFIGGYTRDVDVNPVTQTVQTSPSGTTYDGALGSKAGDCFTFGKSQSNIKTYLDETSLVMGIISFVPMPIYTQTLPKWFLDRDVLDEWSPEFNSLGFQPISNAEVAPIQYFVNEPENLQGTFGYQRPWYDLVSMYDTAHGDFRGPLRNFLMHRVFSGAPKLTRDFTVINPDHVNDVFNVSENTDKIFGQIKIDLKVKQGVAKHAVGRLE